MQDIFGSVRRSLNFENNGVRLSGVVERIGSSIRKSRIGLFNPKPALPPPPTTRENDDGGEHAPPIRWRKGELIGCGAFGRVYMGMNLDSGELLAVKQVLIAPNAASREKTQAHIRELEEEVKLLKNLSHPNIVRYLGTVREEDSLNILLEFVPGGSISSLLGNFGSFPESVIRMYTKQLLLGLEYLHKNGIMHRDIKGANILVDNKGCIRLADFGASKKVVELATINGAKSMKGTPYWMAPEVILQTGHSFSADIWSVGCTVIEMATGKPPWSEQYQEVAALFHIGTTKSHPPIPEHLSPEANDFLLKCLQKEPHLRSSPTELLQHPFVTGKCREFQTSSCTVHMESSGNPAQTTLDLRKSNSSSMGLKDVCNLGSFRHSNVYPEGLSGVGSLWRPNNCDDDMCQLDDKIDVIVGDSVNVGSISHWDDLNKSFNPMCEPIDDWSCKIDEGPGMDKIGVNSSSCQSIHNTGSSSEASGKVENGFSFLSSSFAPEEDDELTESKIRAFLVEKALELKKLQTPLYEEFYNSSNAASCPSPVRSVQFDNIANMANLPPKSRSPSNLPSRRLSAAVEATRIASPMNYGRRVSMHDRALQEIQPHKRNERKEFSDCRQETIGLSASFTERQRKWKEELDEELERKRAMMRQVGLGGKISSPKHTILTRQRERLRFADSGR